MSSQDGHFEKCHTVSGKSANGKKKDVRSLSFLVLIQKIALKPLEKDFRYI